VKRGTGKRFSPPREFNGNAISSDALSAFVRSLKSCSILLEPFDAFVGEAIAPTQYTSLTHQMRFNFSLMRDGIIRRKFFVGEATAPTHATALVHPMQF
jgi:hypothetical protein